jgi:hypothetical protein
MPARLLRTAAHLLLHVPLALLMLPATHHPPYHFLLDAQTALLQRHAPGPAGCAAYSLSPARRATASVLLRLRMARICGGEAIEPQRRRRSEMGQRAL